jgi:hypothetical protein
MRQYLDPDYEISVARIIVGTEPNLPVKFENPTDAEISALVKTFMGGPTEDSRDFFREMKYRRHDDPGDFDARCWELVGQLTAELSQLADEMYRELSDEIRLNPKLRSAAVNPMFSNVTDRVCVWCSENLGITHNIMLMKSSMSVYKLPLRTNIMASFASFTLLFSKYILPT